MSIVQPDRRDSSSDADAAPVAVAGDAAPETDESAMPEAGRADDAAPESGDAPERDAAPVSEAGVSEAGDGVDREAGGGEDRADAFRPSSPRAADDPGAPAEPFSLRPLEFAKILDMLAARTAFSAGRERALALRPSSDPYVVERAQAATEEARRLPALKPGMTLGGARDVRPLVQKASLGGMLQPLELLDVRATVRVAGTWRSTLVRFRETLPTLANVAWRIGDHARLGEEIANAIEEGGEVADSASPKLHQVRRDLRISQDRLMAQLQAMLTTMRASLTDAVITQRNGRYVLPVRAEDRGRVKGIVHDQSASGATVFIEPLAVVEAGNRVRQLEAEERHEVERILRALSAIVGEQAAELAGTVEALAELDLHLAKGRLADEMDAVRPVLHALPRRPGGGPIVRLHEARHPLLTGAVVPLSVELGGAWDVLVITGPNTGGKTVALKTVGLLALMAQAGLQVPAGEGSELAIFQKVFADIGDEQSIEQSLSTFSSHVTHIVEMLRYVDDTTLVLFDELGAGTDPQEGSALARAILVYVRDRGAYAVATTHYSELKAFANSTPRVQNASVEFDPRTLAPTYKLLVGVPGRSNALAIARRLGMPAEVLDQARAMVAPEMLQTEELLAEAQRDRRAAEAAKRDARRAAAEADKLQRRLRAELREAELARREILDRARAESEAMLAELRREAEGRLRALSATGLDRRALRDAAEAVRALEPLPRPEPAPVPFEDEPEPIDDTPAEIRVGAEVVVPRLGMPATILSIAPNGDAELSVRGMRVRVRRAELEEARPATRTERRAVERAEAPAVVAHVSAPPTGIEMQLDLRGRRAEEAAEALDRYLNDAYLAGNRVARIVHGKGTGAVRAAVRAQLARHPLVARFGPAEERQGGDGATEVVLAQ